MHPLIELCAKVVEEAAKDDIHKHVYLRVALLLRSLPQSEINKVAGKPIATVIDNDEAGFSTVDAVLPCDMKLYAAPAALPDGRDEASKAISEPLSISMEQVERLGEAHHIVMTILDELVCAVDGIDSLDEWDEEYGPAIERLDKAIDAARPYTEKVMLANERGEPKP